MSSLLLPVLLAATLDPRPTWVEYQAPVECPDKAAFQAELGARTELVRFAPSTAEATAHVTVVLKLQARRFTGTLEVRTSDGARTRKTLKGPRCQTLTRAMTLTAALVLDPEGAKTVLPAEEPPSPPVLEPVPAPPPPVEPAAPVVVAPVAPPAPPAPPQPPLVVQPPPPPPAPRWVLDVAAGAWLSTGVSGQLDVGGGARVAVSRGTPEQLVRPRASLGVGAVSGRTVTAAVGSARVDAHALLELELGGELAWGLLRARAGAFAQLMPVVVTGLEGDEQVSSLRWLWAVGPALSLGVQLAQWHVSVRAGLGLALRRETYVIEPRGEVFRVPGAALSGALEVGRAF